MDDISPLVESHCRQFSMYSAKECWRGHFNSVSVVKLGYYVSFVENEVGFRHREACPNYVVSRGMSISSDLSLYYECACICELTDRKVIYDHPAIRMSMFSKKKKG